MFQTLRRSRLSAVVALAACLLHASAMADPLLRITEVMSKPSDLFATPDWFELTNFSQNEIDLSFYAVDDNSFSLNQSAFLNSTTGGPIIIKPGESVVFVEGQSTAATAFRSSWNLPETVQIGYYAGSGISFSSGGDGATVFDNTDTELPGPFGGLIRVSFPAATTGRSFFWNYAADGSLGSASAGTVTPTADEDPFSMSWTYTLSDGVTQETQFATPGKAVLAAEGIGILRWAGPAGDGGSGNWISSSPLTWRDGVAPVAWDASSIASFPSTNPTAGTVTLTESVAAAELDFGKSGYTIAASSTAHTLSLNSGIVNTAAGTITTINAALDGPVGLAKTGAGLLLLGSPHNQYDGITSVAFGTLRLTGSGVLPSTTLVSIGLTGVVDLAGRSTTIAGLQGLGDLTLGSGTLTIGIPDDADREHNGNLSGQGSVIIDSAGTGEQAFGLRTSTSLKSKSYSGKTIIRQGTLRISQESAPTATSGIEIEEGGRLKLSTSTQTGNYFFGLNGSNDVNTAVTLLGGTLTNSEGEITQLDNDVVISGTLASIIEVNEENAPTPENPNVANLILAGALRGGGIANVVGNGTVTLGTDAAPYSGSASDFTGVLRVGDAAAVGKMTLANLAGSIGSGQVVVQSNGAVQAAEAVPFAAQSVQLAGGELRLDADSGSVTTFNQTAVSVTADSTIAVRRAADVEATLAPSYALPLTFSGGNLSITAPTRAATNATAYAASPTFTSAVTLEQDATVMVVNPAVGSNHVTFSGTVGDGGAGRGLTKAGDGVLTLAATNTYSGDTLVNGGRLALGSAGSIASSARIAVASGATFDVTSRTGGYVVASVQTLGGSGTVDGGLTIGSGATVEPGSSPGTLTVTQGVTWASGGNYNWQIVDAAGTGGTIGGWDLLSVGGVLDITATSGSPFAINLWSLSSTGPDTNGSIANWNATQGSTRRIATAAGGITGFSADKFTINTSAANGTGGFANGLSGGTFSVAQAGNDLNLVFTSGSTAPPDTGPIVIDVPSGSQTQAEAGRPALSGDRTVTKTGGGTVVFDTANTHTAQTTVQQGSLKVSHADALASSPTVVAAGATLHVDPGVTMKAPSVTVQYTGTLSAPAIAVNASTGVSNLTIDGGSVAGSPAVTVGAGGTMSLADDIRQAVSVASLTVDQAAGGKIDIGKGRINVAAGGITGADLRADLAAARNGGAWNGASGIGSSEATNALRRAVGYRVQGTSATIAWAAFGDMNLDGFVNSSDLNLLIASGKYGSSALDGVWAQGDFNYDGRVNSSDLNLLLAAGLYGQGSYLPATTRPLGGLGFADGEFGGLAGMGDITAVPEPSSLLLSGGGILSMAIFAAVNMLNRRRRGSS